MLRVTKNTINKLNFDYNINVDILKEEPNIKYLGVKINNRMSWNPHLKKKLQQAYGQFSSHNASQMIMPPAFMFSRCSQKAKAFNSADYVDIHTSLLRKQAASS